MKLVTQSKFLLGTCLAATLSVVLLLTVGGRSAELNDGTSKDAFYPVPEWAKNAIWYQIFPERFRNGDQGNDPMRNDLIGSWPHYSPQGWQPSPWTSDWYKLQQWEQTDDKGFYVHVQNRRYGGDLQGVFDRLDYLQQLGITALYFNPLFESPSLHKYDATLYHHIDNNFGPDPAGDRAIWAKENPADPATWQWTSADKLFLRLIQEAHKRGMKVIIDGVFNHVGMTFWAFEDVKKNGAKSKHKDWFTIKRWDDPKTQENEFDYEGWFGVRELPEVREDENGLVKGPREHVHAIAKRWMDPNGDGNPEDGIDGWRLDVAEMVNKNFWRDFRRWVRAINPEAYLTGEVWWEDWNNEKMFNAAPWLQGDVFDAVMNYRWAREAFRFFSGDKSKITASELAVRLQEQWSEYPSDVNYVLQNLYDSHDTDRFASHILNADALYDKRVGFQDNRQFNVAKPGERERAIQKLMVFFQMTSVGAPMIYYGTEAGMWGADDPDCRKPMVWDDLDYETESVRPFGMASVNDPVKFDSDLYAWYSSFTHYRLEHPALRTGKISFLKTDDENDVLAYHRGSESDNVIVVLNASEQRRDVVIDLPADLAGKRWMMGAGNTTFEIRDNRLVVTLQSRSGLAIHSEQSEQ
ncbi:MAG: glycoside hydrolase family 13 protein [Ignavibacteriae bacterium]|nr:glycoside hydrolase family 13 protein [Ignavibacteriota bacterium]